jgi:hypothetical protein
MQETASCTVAVCDSSKVAYTAFLEVLYTTYKCTHSHGHRLEIAQTPRLLSIGSFYGLACQSGYACTCRSKFEARKRADERTRTADLISLRMSGRRLGRGALHNVLVSWEAFRRTKGFERIRHRLPYTVQKGISYRTAWAAHLSPRLSSRNRSRVEGEWFW